MRGEKGMRSIGNAVFPVPSGKMNGVLVRDGNRVYRALAAIGLMEGGGLIQASRPRAKGDGWPRDLALGMADGSGEVTRMTNWAEFLLGLLGAIPQYGDPPVPCGN